MDVNEAFENLLLTEEIAEQSAYEEGYNVGKKRLFEGYHFGYHRGSSIGAQLGYYSGTLLLYKNHKNDKIADNANKLLQEIKQFPRNNDENTDINAQLENYKCRFNRFCSLVKINPSYPEVDKLSF